MNARFLRVVILGLLAVGAGALARAATVTWDGEGEDNNWSTAANWSGDAVPGTGDDAVFDDTSSKDCTVDSSVEVASLTVSSDYGGTVSLGSGTVTLNTGDFYAPSGHFSAGTSTLKFTGSSLQKLRFTISSTPARESTSPAYRETPRRGSTTRAAPPRRRSPAWRRRAGRAR